MGNGGNFTLASFFSNPCSGNLFVMNTILWIGCMNFVTDILHTLLFGSHQFHGTLT